MLYLEKLLRPVAIEEICYDSSAARLLKISECIGREFFSLSKHADVVSTVGEFQQTGFGNVGSVNALFEQLEANLYSSSSKTQYDINAKFSTLS